MGRLNWSKPRKLRDYEIEEKYEPGTVMGNGRMVSYAPRDTLAARAAAAERDWLAEKAEKTKRQKARRRKNKKPPTPGELTRLKAIRRQLDPSGY